MTCPLLDNGLLEVQRLVLGQAFVLYPVAGITRFTNAERYKLIQVAQERGLDPEILAAVISIESGFRTNPNPKAKAAGLIQWIPSTAKAVHGLTTDQIRRMNACAQLDLVRDYFKRVMPGGAKIRGDEYVATFVSSFIGKSNETVIAEKDNPQKLPNSNITQAQVYSQNSGLDFNKDGVITVGDVRGIVIARANTARTKPAIPVTPESCTPSNGVTRTRIGTIPLLLGVAAVGYGTWWYFRR